MRHTHLHRVIRPRGVIRPHGVILGLVPRIPLSAARSLVGLHGLSSGDRDPRHKGEDDGFVVEGVA